MFEERVVGDGDFVVIDVGFATGEAERLGVGDEVDLVATGGEFDAEFGGDDSTAAVGGVTGDADLHRCPLLVAGCWLERLMIRRSFVACLMRIVASRCLRGLRSG